MLTAAQETAFHEAGHAAVALLRGVAVKAVGMTPGQADTDGVCMFAHPDRPSTAATLADEMVIAAAGPVAQNLAGGRYDPAREGPNGDFRAIDVFAREAAKLAPPGWRPPAAVAEAARELSDPVVWAGVVALARVIVFTGGMVDGAVAAAAMRTGWRDRGLVDRIRAAGPRAIW